jgi:hypothetical protein
MSFDPRVFGEGFHQFVQKEIELFGSSLGVIFHIVTFIILFLVFRYGNKYRKIFTIYFTFNWIFLFGYWGIYAVVYWYQLGIPYLAVYSLTPVLLGLIVYYWIKENINPLIDWDFKSTSRKMFIVIIILVWGLWYPSYIYGQGFVFSIKDVVFSNYGLMPCPTTMVVLSLMTLKYPVGNKNLYKLFTVYALFIGTAKVMSGWIPDVPFIVLGIYSLSLIIYNKKRDRQNNKINER